MSETDPPNKTAARTNPRSRARLPRLGKAGIAIITIGSGFTFFARLAGFARGGDWSTVLFIVVVVLAGTLLVIASIAFIYYTYAAVPRRAVRAQQLFPGAIVFVAWTDALWPRVWRKRREISGFSGVALVAVAGSDGISFYRSRDMKTPVWTAAWSAIQEVSTLEMELRRWSGLGLEFSRADPDRAFSFRVTAPGSLRARVAKRPEVTDLAQRLEGMRLNVR